MRNDPNDMWLINAEVQYRIEEKNSRWYVLLIFVDTKDPSHFVIKRIGDYHSHRLAEIYAINMVKTAAKDPRGTQKVKIDAYNINNN